MFTNKTILAPLTKGGNLPFRRLCASFGADVTVSEMAYARFVARGERREQALLRSHPTEGCFGVQFAVINPEEAIKASKIAVERGAQFIDINCGCPIEDTTRRGLGASILRKPNVLSRLVEALSREIPVPVTVKIRLGWNEKEINAPSLAVKVAEAGAAAITVHGRTREQRYSRAANWESIGEIKKLVTIPVIGNGDILTYFEAEDKKRLSGADSIMIGRGALIKPWIFSEIKKGASWNITSEERVMVYLQLAQYMKEHFRDDEKGMKRIMQFLPWHFSLFCRYQFLPKEQFHEQSLEHPLIQTRIEPQLTDDPLDHLLSSTNELVHEEIVKILLDSTESNACGRLRGIQLSSPESTDEAVFPDMQG